jgi:energy-coupling factor transporter ATP-binding protein EcfA2
MEQAFDTVMLNLQHPGPLEMMFIYGPTGAGKTTLCLKMNNELLKVASTNPEQFIGRVPVAGIDLDTDERPTFDWLYHYYRPAIRALHEPEIDRKIQYTVQGVAVEGSGRFEFRRQIKRPEYREILKEALIQRYPLAFWVDNAHLLAKAASGAAQDNNVTSIFKLAHHTGVPHVLFGTYDMLSMVGLKSELARQTVNIHLRRYQKKIKGDEDAFADVLYNFQIALPIENQPDLRKWTDYWWEQSLGCVGILKDQLTLACQDALERNASTIGPENWEQFGKPEWELRRMEQQISEGEALLNFKMTGQIATRENSKPDPSIDDNPSKKGKGNPRPGDRNPARDKVGSPDVPHLPNS